MAKKGWFLKMLAGLGTILAAIFLLKNLRKNDGSTTEGLQEKAQWHKDRDREEQKRLDEINREKNSRSGVHKQNKDNFSRPVSGILILVFFFTAVVGRAEYIKEVDGELRDFGTAKKYERFLEKEREDYQKDVEIRDKEIKVLRQNNTTKSNIIAVQDEELRIRRKHDKPLIRFIEKIDFELGLTAGFLGALGLSKIIKNLN